MTAADLTRFPPPPEPVDDGRAATANTPQPDLGLVDWRFLLPDLELGAVGLDADAPAELDAALATCSEVVQRLDGSGVARYDTVVLVRPTPAVVRAAMGALAVDGSLRIDRLPVRGRRRILRDLRGAGLDVSTWWSRPSGSKPWAMVSLDDTASAVTVLRTVAGRGRRALIEGWMVRSGLARRFGDVAVIARAAAADDGALPAVASPSTDGDLAGLVTPHFAASRAVIGVSTTDSGKALARVAKLARGGTDNDRIRAEAAALDEFRARADETPRVPDHHHLAVRAGRLVLVEDAVQGQALDRRRVRHDPEAALAAGAAWLNSVPSSAPTKPASDGRASDLLIEPLDAIARLATSHPERRRDHLRRAERLLTPLHDMALPQVFEHGDFSHPNLFVGPDDDLAVIDWERARLRGMPLHDLTFFVAYLAESRDRPKSSEALVDAYRSSLRSGGWASADRDLHVEHIGVDPHLVRLLELACWTRVLALLDEPGRREVASDGHRSEVLWIASIEDAEEAWR